MSTAYLLILGDREVIAWVLGEQRMAFPRTPRAEVAASIIPQRPVANLNRVTYT